MRDLYHRQDRLTYWIRRVHTDLEEPDRTEVLKLIGDMQDRERAILWIIRCITALLLIRKQLGKPFRNATKDDIRSILKWMEQKSYKASTNEKFRQILKLFYKTIYGNSEYYPEQVKWFSVKVAKEKTGKETSMDMAEYLEEEEVQKLVESALQHKRKHFLQLCTKVVPDQKNFSDLLIQIYESIPRAQSLCLGERLERGESG
jgi:hypothetical protein